MKTNWAKSLKRIDVKILNEAKKKKPNNFLFKRKKQSNEQYSEKKSKVDRFTISSLPILFLTWRARADVRHDGNDQLNGCTFETGQRIVFKAFANLELSDFLKSLSRQCAAVCCEM